MFDWNVTFKASEVDTMLEVLERTQADMAYLHSLMRTLESQYDWSYAKEIHEELDWHETELEVFYTILQNALHDSAEADDPENEEDFIKAEEEYIGYQFMMYAKEHYWINKHTGEANTFAQARNKLLEFFDFDYKTLSEHYELSTTKID